MSLCDDFAARWLTEIALSFAWSCSEVDSETIALRTGRSTRTSEPVTIYARVFGTDVVLSDGGQTLSRLHEQGMDLDDPIHQTLWNEAVRTYRVSEADGRVYLPSSERRVAFDLNRFADVLVGLDALGLVLLPAEEREEPFAAEVESFLRHQYSESQVARRPRIRVRGIDLRPTLRIETNRQVLLQTGSGPKGQQFDHAYTLFTLADKGGIPTEDRLVVLGGRSASWPRPRIDLLAEVAYVGFWGAKDSIVAFLDGQVPNDRVLAGVTGGLPFGTG